MACPNKQTDAEILAKIKERQTIKIAPEAEVLYNYYHWIGKLTDIQFLAIDESQIVSICRIGENEWEATLSL
jgi:hypothetical protein